MEGQNFFSFVLFLFCFTGEVFPDNTCDGDWEPYKDEKCLKVFDTEIESYEEAESYCKEKYDANLVSIGLEDKQKFVEDFLKSKNVVDYVWIGLKYQSDNNYVWSDGAFFSYSNWADGSPKNDPDYCVQISTDEAEFGKWVDVQCIKRNIVLCEKVQPWSLSQLQNEFMNLKKNVVPIGFIYVQLPKEKPPAEIWSWMVWEDVTEDYAGVFFRAEGGDSSSFGSVQEDASPRLTKFYHEFWQDGDGPFEPGVDYAIPADGNGHRTFFTKNEGTDLVVLYLSVSESEVRPRNMAVRIWKRTQ